MRFSLATVLSVVGMASVSQAAECSAWTGHPNCVIGSELKANAAHYCSLYWNVVRGDWIYFIDSAGNQGQQGKIGWFPSEAECNTAFNEIMDECYGQRDGGTWTADGVTLSLWFCNW